KLDHVAGGVYSQPNNVDARVFFGQVVQVGHFFHTWRAPSGPEINNQRFAQKAFQAAGLVLGSGELQVVQGVGGCTRRREPAKGSNAGTGKQSGANKLTAIHSDKNSRLDQRSHVYNARWRKPCTYIYWGFAARLWVVWP